ncbi:S8 family serine peptidase [Lentzea jiangxiensis]|uniref:Peptidase inhibitor I9 n=1 Tax=Lentzea jiangxiensis TaxID=641025 RepID=A0A1H0V5E9_9PSEU|nr:S8 family serine peptidase [Lentzea jiangxiensis]SDP73398.1 Peptidase inhibitor I9 [Lentzea jiangxiensis]
MRKTATLLGSAVVVAAFAAPATAAGEIRVSPGENIAGSFIVKLKDDAVAVSAQTLGSRFGGQVGHVYDAVFQGFSIRTSDARARGLAAHPSVEYVERDQVVSIQATQTNPPSWGLDRIDQRNLPLDQRHTYNTTGFGVNAYIYGAIVDVFAPGSGITSAWHTSDTATNTISGTSMASPHVAGVVARYLQGNRNVTPAQVATAITSNATDGKVTNPGPSTTTRLLHWAPTS